MVIISKKRMQKKKKKVKIEWRNASSICVNNGRRFFSIAEEM